MKRSDDRGFTLLEMMVVITVIAVLAAIAIPRYGDSLRTSTEGYTRGSLGTMRKALSVYYSDLDGQYPSDLTALTLGGRFLKSLPAAKVPPFHADSRGVLLASAPDDGGGWLYDGAAGTIRVNCTHADMKGSVWTSY
jgi:general secretion pathway protein G